MGAANANPRQFPYPDRFDVRATNAAGAHGVRAPDRTVPGMNLAKLERRAYSPRLRARSSASGRGEEAREQRPGRLSKLMVTRRNKRVCSRAEAHNPCDRHYYLRRAGTNSLGCITSRSHKKNGCTRRRPPAVTNFCSGVNGLGGPLSARTTRWITLYCHSGLRV